MYNNNYTFSLDTNFHKVIVDPGNGQVLVSQEISQKEWMKMQQIMHVVVVLVAEE
jgi:hypothetical protein